ncbi:MAG: NAD-dependent epimerase/dehydratase family protein [Methylococcaceae bacterium]|nr:NAD-dependent epimerase/dehydratase family protein [Methylococcaceae bacterium]
MKKILLTGATGFVGKALLAELLQNNFEVIASIRNTPIPSSLKVQTITIDSLLASTDWSPALQKTDIVIHSAARVHIMKDFSTNPLAEFRKTNVDGTLNLARQAKKSGVSRFIFISSIKANSHSSRSQSILRPDDTTPPTDPYGLSKYEAEQGLLELAKNSTMEIVIIRPPLVYGPNVKGNFLSLLKYIKKELPLPLGSINNQRSLVALDNLVDFIHLCATHPKAANEIFLISDGEDVSTTELLIKIARAFNKKLFLIPIPALALSFIAKLFGKDAMVNRLLESLQVDNSKAIELIGWRPVISMDSQLKKIADFHSK